MQANVDMFFFCFQVYFEKQTTAVQHSGAQENAEKVFSYRLPFSSREAGNTTPQHPGTQENLQGQGLECSAEDDARPWG